MVFFSISKYVFGSQVGLSLGEHLVEFMIAALIANFSSLSNLTWELGAPKFSEWIEKFSATFILLIGLIFHIVKPGIQVFNK